jgi:hypothetical protein
MQNINEIDIITQLDVFILSNIRTAWLENKYMKVYVRKAFHNIDGVCECTFDVANVTVFTKYQKRGHFKNLMQHVETLGRSIYVESINNPDLKSMLIKNGYTIDYTGYNAYKKV